MRKLYRSSRDRKIFGVCGGVAEYLGVDATLLRILLVIVAVFSAGSLILVYILAGFIIPKEAYPGGFGPGPSPYAPGWNGQGAHGTHQPPPQYGNQGWPPGSNWPGAGVPPTPPVRPMPNAEPAPAAPRTEGLDAMMEDIEKKAMRREIDELKAKITKIEKDSKGE